MPAKARLVTAGRVGRPHGLEGSFVVEDPRHPLGVGTCLRVCGSERRIERRGGTEERPLVRLEGVRDREGAAALTGELMLVREALAEGEWLAGDLVGCVVEGVGTVRAVTSGPSCDVLELDDGTLVPLVADAVRRVDAGSGRIEVDRRFLGLEEAP